MARKKKVNDYGTGIPVHEVDALARILPPEDTSLFRERGRTAGVCKVESTKEKDQDKTGITRGGNI